MIRTHEGRTTVSPFSEGGPSVFTVSELNSRIKGLLESSYRLVWVKGEISNFRIPGSGHCYFTLKDESSQIRAVLFRPQLRHLRFTPEAGLQVLCQGRISVYEPRGEYQLIVEVMEPQGLGALQLAFEQLKKKLEAEGLFDAGRKKPLPVAPQTIGIVTSPTGAAVRDILKILQRSPYPISATIFPVRVQGAEASREIAAAIETANLLAEKYEWDLLIVGRGGGSIEDLWPFNEEIVARAIASSTAPVISAVGHEIDFTISDLVCDLRMPTPTAAAEWVVAQLDRFQRELENGRDRLAKAVQQKIQTIGQKVQFLEKRLTDPRRRLADIRLMVDDRLERLQMALVRKLERLRALHANLGARLLFVQPAKRVQEYRNVLDQQVRELAIHAHKALDSKGFLLKEYASRLESVSPLAVLGRGYSITYRLPDKKHALRSSDETRPGDKVMVRLSRGNLKCTVDETNE